MVIMICSGTISNKGMCLQNISERLQADTSNIFEEVCLCARAYEIHIISWQMISLSILFLDPATYSMMIVNRCIYRALSRYVYRALSILLSMWT